MTAHLRPHPQAVELLQELSLGAHLARCLAYLGTVEEATSREIEAATNLRQPHVSAALRALEERGWIRYRVEKRAGAGRPRHVYRLTRDLAQIVGEVKAAETLRFQHLSGVVERLQRFRVWEKARVE